MVLMKRILGVFVLSWLLVSCQESLEEKCAREVREYNEKKCPAPIGENMVIDSLGFDRATHTLHYYYTLKGAADDAERIKNSGAYDLLLDEIKNATSVKEYKEAGYSFSYTYMSAKDKGKVLFEVTFTKEDYGTAAD